MTACTDCRICDGSGVLAITDWPESRVVVCPSFPIDADEPLAYHEAVEGLGYAGPATMQQRIRDNVLAEVAKMQQVKPAPIRAQYTVSARASHGILIALAVCIPFWIGVGALVSWWRR